jgi:response regulator RpfG family c-di-GMP phosphodiesterase
MKYPNAVVLVVDDDPEIGKMVKASLKNIAAVHAFMNPFKALDFAKGVKVTVALVDQCMPHLEGTEFLKKLQECSPTTYRILISGYCEKEVSNQAYATRLAHYYLAKPWSVPEIRAIVSMAINNYFDAKAVTHI